MGPMSENVPSRTLPSPSLERCGQRHFGATAVKVRSTDILLPQIRIPNASREPGLHGPRQAGLAPPGLERAPLALGRLGVAVAALKREGDRQPGVLHAERGVI